MDAMDRLDWVVGTALTSFGTRIGVRATRADALPLLLERLPPGTKPAPGASVDRLYSFFAGDDAPTRGVRRLNLVYANMERLARSSRRDLVVEAFETDVRRYVAEWARHRLFVHAGVVGWRGRAIVIPGRTYTGKTTLVAALVKAGAQYYSDEFAVFDRQGRVHPFSTPLGIRGEGARQFPQTAEALGGTRGYQPLAVGLVVVTGFRADARWRPRLLTEGRGVLELLTHTIAARREPNAALKILPKVVARARVFKGARGEAHAVAHELLEQLDRKSQ